LGADNIKGIDFLGMYFAVTVKKGAIALGTRAGQLQYSRLKEEFHKADSTACFAPEVAMAITC
jgi:hypothetical protein